MKKNGRTLQQIVEETEKAAIAEALEEFADRDKAAARLGVSTATLQTLITKYDLDGKKSESACPLCARKTPDFIPDASFSMDDMMNRLERAIVVAAIEKCGNMTKAAAFLQMPYHSIRHLVEKHKLKS